MAVRLKQEQLIAAHGPGMQIISIPFDFTFFTRSSPGSQMLGMPASLTNAIDFPELRLFIIFGIFFKELCLLKLIRLFLNLNLFIIFFVCLVSSQAIKETFLRIFNALKEISFKFPIGVPTIYKTPTFRFLCFMR